MARLKQPSARSLAPKPRKEPVRYCPRMHRLYGKSTAANCYACQMERVAAENAKANAARAAAERAEWQARIGTPRFLETLVVSTGKVRRYEIPPHMIPRRRRARARA